MERELLRSQCEAYLLGVLEGEELAAFEQILQQGGSEVTALMRESADLVARVGFTALGTEPSPLVRTRLMKAVSESLPVTPRRIPVWGIAGWAVAAALAVAGFFTLQREASYRAGLEAAQRDLAGLRSEAAGMRKVMEVIMSRDTKLIRLTTAAPEVPQFQAFWSTPHGLVLTGAAIPAPKPGRTLQLWIVPKSGNPVSAGVFRPDSGGQVLHFSDSAAVPASAKALAISDEPEGGSAQPTTAPAWVGALGE